MASARASFNATTAFLLRWELWGAFDVADSFNATTAFLLRWRSWRGGRGSRAFQCHHGVPASRRLRGRRGSSGSRFNATTAFLLRWAFVSSIVAVIGFNATTAFLLRQIVVLAGVVIFGFNATTAFLLPVDILRNTS